MLESLQTKESVMNDDSLSFLVNSDKEDDFEERVSSQTLGGDQMQPSYSIAQNEKVMAIWMEWILIYG